MSIVGNFQFLVRLTVKTRVPFRISSYFHAIAILTVVKEALSIFLALLSVFIFAIFCLAVSGRKCGEAYVLQD